MRIERAASKMFHLRNPHSVLFLKEGIRHQTTVIPNPQIASVVFENPEIRHEDVRRNAM